MKIYSIWFKNFGSYGNNLTKITFSEKNEIIGILGQNGSGKSTVIHALYFALFGKSFTGTNKPELVNRINQGDLLVGVEFEQKGDVYIIERGLKPTFIKIIKNDKPQDLDSNLTNIQKFLENNILDINEMLFRQMFMIGMGNFKSFFTLPIASRREIFERIVGLNVLSVMKKKVFLKDKDFQQQLKELESKRENAQEQKKFYKNQLIKAEKQNSESLSKNEIKELEQKIKALSKEIKNLTSKIEDTTTILENIKEINNEIEVQQDKITEERFQLKMVNNKISELTESVEFFKENDVCPECEQPIKKTFKNKKIQFYTKEIKDNEKVFSGLEKNIKKYNNKIEELKKDLKETQKKLKKSQEFKDFIHQKEREMETFKKQIEFHSTSKEREESYYKTTIEEINSQVSSIADTILNLQKEKKGIEKSLKINDKIAFVLSDEGFKKYVYTNFLPLLNKYVTENLKFFDFSMNFYLDSNLNENFYVKLGENISFSTLSNGEKQVAELAFLFALQRFLEEIYNFKLDCQFFDELFDTSLDSDKLYYLMNFLRTLDKKIIIISHNPSVNENFDKLFRVVRDSHFSQIQEI